MVTVWTGYSPSRGHRLLLELNCAQKIHADEFFSACEREGTKSSSCSGQPTALEFTSKMISPRGPRCSSRFVLSSSLSSWFQLQAAVVPQSPLVDHRPRQHLRRLR